MGSRREVRAAASVLATLGVTAVLTTLGPSRAAACSYVPPCLETPVLGLVGDVTARPVNACIAVRHAGLPWSREPFVPELVYEAADGSRVPLVAGEVEGVYCPTSALAPDADHRLVRLGVADALGCGTLAETELLAFHTGLAPDDAPPSPPGDVLDDPSCYRDICESDGCCGPYDTVVHVSSWASATDDTGVVAYVVDGALRLENSLRWSESGPTQPTSAPWPFDARPTEVRAIDIAGHVSEPAVRGPICVPAPSSADDGGPESADAGTDADASVASADASTDGGRGGGCTVSRRATPAGPALAILGLALARRARRRDPATRTNPRGRG